MVRDFELLGLKKLIDLNGFFKQPHVNTCYFWSNAVLDCKTNTQGIFNKLFSEG